MEQRRLRLGDTLDDYCPRERRVTNHAIVAMVEDDIKQTRCTTCDAEHPYKGGKAPRRRKQETPAALYKEVLAGMPDGDAAPALTVPAAPAPVDATLDSEADQRAAASHEPHAAEPDLEMDEEPESDIVPQIEEGPVHRPLIRATLPRPEGQKDARPVPEFTIRQSAGRGGNGHFRGARPARGHAGVGGGNGNRAAGPRFQGPRPAGQGRGPGAAARGGQNRGAQGGGFRGRKRSR